MLKKLRLQECTERRKDVVIAYLSIYLSITSPFLKEKNICLK